MVAWLVSQIRFSGWHWTPLDVIETERQYPGLLNAINIEVWQQQLIEKQVKSEGTDSDDAG